MKATAIAFDYRQNKVNPMKTYFPPTKNYWCSPALHDFLFAPFHAVSKDHGNSWQLFAHIWEQMQHQPYATDPTRYLPLPTRSGNDKGFIEQYFPGAEVQWMTEQGLLVTRAHSISDHKCREYRVAQSILDGSVQHMTTRNQQINLYSGNTRGRRKRHNQIKDQHNNYLVGELEKAAIDVLNRSEIKLNITNGFAYINCITTLEKARQASSTMQNIVAMATKEIGDYIYHSPRYSAADTGRIYDGALQNAKTEMREAMIGEMMAENGGTYRNYDIESSHQSAWCQYLRQYSCDAEADALEGYMQKTKTEHANELGLDKETYKRMLYSIGYNAGDIRTKPVNQARKTLIRISQLRDVKRHRVLYPFGSKDKNKGKQQQGKKKNKDNDATYSGIHKHYKALIRSTFASIHKMRLQHHISVSKWRMIMQRLLMRDCIRAIRAQITKSSETLKFNRRIFRHFTPIRRAVLALFDAAINDPALCKVEPVKGTVILNACGRKLYFNKCPRHKIKSRCIAHLCQGREAAFIHTLTVLGSNYGYVPLANMHDGLIVDGTIPSAAIDEVNAKLGTSFKFLEKPL